MPRRRRRSGAGAGSAASSGGTSVVYPRAHGLHPRMGGPAEVWQMCEAQRPGKLRLAGGVRGIHANTMRVEDAKKAAKLQGGITQQSAEDATFQQNGVDVESARSARLISPVNIVVVRAFANHKPLVPSHRKADPRHLRKSDPQRSSRLPRCCQP